MKIHEGQPLLQDGSPPDEASAVLILLHGRGGSAEDMIELGRALSPEGMRIATLAPQASSGSWYPQRFLAPIALNEPHLGSALGVIARLADGLLAKGVSRERMVFAGFSQGACLAMEYAARHPHRYGGVAGFSGALIGPPGTRRDVPGSLKGTPIFIGCGDTDRHIPVESVRETAAAFVAMGADVTERIYPGMPHTLCDDEIAAVLNIVRRAGSAGAGS
jgi:predicted esterase